MAKVVFDAFVEEVARSNRDGSVFALRTAETHRRKDDDGNYHTTARTYRRVKLTRESSSSLDRFVKGDRVHVEGTEKTEKFTATDGRDLYSITVYADVVEPSGNSNGRPSYGPRSTMTAPTFTTDETPF